MHGKAESRGTSQALNKGQVVPALGSYSRLLHHQEKDARTFFCAYDECRVGAVSVTDLLILWVSSLCLIYAEIESK